MANDANFRSSFDSRIGRMLASHRRAGNFKLCDTILSLMDGTQERVHSAILAVNSRRFQRVLSSPSASPPFEWDLSFLSPEGVAAALDWAYHGKAIVVPRGMSDALAAAAYLEIPDLHAALESRLRRLGRSAATLPAAIAAAASPSAQVSLSTCRALSDALLSSKGSSSLSALSSSPSIAPWLLHLDDAGIGKKIRAIQIVLKWLSAGRQSSAAVLLDHIAHTGLNPNDERALIDCLTQLVASSPLVHIERDSDGRIVVRPGNAAEVVESESNLETAAVATSPISRTVRGMTTESALSVCDGPMAYSPMGGMARELASLPDPFKSHYSSAPSKNAAEPKSLAPVFKAYIPTYIPDRKLDSDISVKSFARSVDSVADIIAIPDVFVEGDSIEKSANDSRASSKLITKGASQNEPTIGYNASVSDVPASAHPMIPDSQSWLAVRVGKSPENPADIQSAYAYAALNNLQLAGRKSGLN